MNSLENKPHIEPSMFSVMLPVSKSLSNEQQTALRTLLEKGLPNISAPYQKIADDINASEQQVITQIKTWQESGLIKRFGLVVKHRQLGFNANAMVVWNIPDALIPQVAKQLSSFNEVSLCYKRPRRLPDWPYNLFCMIHGTDRNIVLGQIKNIYQQLLTLNPSLQSIDKNILFSTKAYKQNGARYSSQRYTSATNKEAKRSTDNKDVSHG